MQVVVIDYGSGNLRSAAKALERAAADMAANVAVAVSGDAERVRRADRIVLPGVGAFGDCMAGLTRLAGMREALDEAVIAAGRPFLGICVGMQLMAQRSFEHGERAGLGWIAGEVVSLDPSDTTLKIPHMGWNELTVRQPHPLLAGMEDGAHAYFVHSFALRCAAPASVLAEVEYGGPVAAVVGRDNLVGTQFHPEKSQATGLTLLRNFLGWRP